MQESNIFDKSNTYKKSKEPNPDTSAFEMVDISPEAGE